MLLWFRTYIIYNIVFFRLFDGLSMFVVVWIAFLCSILFLWGFWFCIIGGLLVLVLCYRAAVAGFPALTVDSWSVS